MFPILYKSLFRIFLCLQWNLIFLVSAGNSRSIKYEQICDSTIAMFYVLEFIISKNLGSKISAILTCCFILWRSFVTLWLNVPLDTCYSKNKGYNLPVTKFTLWSFCVPHLAQASFLPQNQTLQNGFLISFIWRWHSVVKNYEIWTFKVNFLCQKT